MIWLLAKLPTTKILDDDIDQYICFTNTHDGTGAVRACCTPIRVVCNNTLNLALSTAKRVWSCVHKGKIEDKLIEASQTLELANKYTEALDKKAQQLANTSLNNDKIKEIINELFPIDTTDSDRQIANIEQAKKEFMICYYMPDIAKFQNTAWGLVNAASDFISHTAPKRNTATYNERNFERIIYGHPFIDKITDLIAMKK